MRAACRVVLVLTTVLACSSPVFAQKKPVQEPVAGQGLRAFASWLDDADVLERGAWNLGVATGRWDGTNGGQWDLAFDASAGATDWLQLSVSLPYYQASYDTGFSGRGRGDTYLWAKIRLLDASEHHIGVAVLPLVEVLSDAALADPSLGLSRTNWALPVSIQAGSDTTRAYGTFGYFSRGAVFAAVAVERSLSDRFTVSATLNYTHSLHDLTGTDLQALGRNRVDGTVGGSVQIAPKVGAYVNVGRTISTLDEDGARLIFGAGLSVTISRSAAKSGQ